MDGFVGARIGNYELVRELGRGGMGVVYEAVDHSLQRAVAIKVLPVELAHDLDVRARFLREARSAANINHPNVATVHHVDEHSGRLYIVMEFVSGQNLRELLTTGRLDAGTSIRFAKAIAGALEKAHATGIVHRDLKPENVMISATGRVKLLDFGIAKFMNPVNVGAAVGDAKTLPGEVLGTPGYWAPEQVSGKAIDARADVFSFGVVLYEMLTGRRPFDGKTPLELLAAVLQDTPTPVRGHVPSCPAEIDLVVTACLAKDPAQRPSDGAALVAALANLPETGGAVVVTAGPTVDPIASTAVRPAMTESLLEFASTCPQPLPLAGETPLLVVPSSVSSPPDVAAHARHQGGRALEPRDPFEENRLIARQSRAQAELQALVDAAIRGAVSELGFPPLTLLATASGQRIELRAIFESSHEHGLVDGLVVIFATQTDAATGVVTVDACGALVASGSQARTLPFSSVVGSTIFSGPADPDLAKTVRSFMASALDIARVGSGAASNVEGHVKWLRLAG